MCGVHVCSFLRLEIVHEESVTELPPKIFVIFFLTPRVKIPNLSDHELEGVYPNIRHFCVLPNKSWIRLHDHHHSTDSQSLVCSVKDVQCCILLNWFIMLSFVSSSEHPLTASGDEIGPSLAVKGSLTDQRAQCEHAHLLFLSIKHRPPPLSLLLLILPPAICPEVRRWLS